MIKNIRNGKKLCGKNSITLDISRSMGQKENSGSKNIAQPRICGWDS